MTRSRRPVLRFVLGFCLLMGPCTLFFYGVLVHTRLFETYLEWNAIVSAAILRLFGEDAQAIGVLLQSSRSSLEIRHGCDAILPTALFVAAVVAAPVALRSKLPGLVLGAAALLALNLIRILSLYFAQAYYPDWVHWMHLDFWQPAFIFAALWLWVLWALRAISAGGLTDEPAP